MTCMCTEMRIVKLCMNFSMNFKSSSASDNKMPIELHTLCVILMCHIKSKHKASATGPTQICFFQIPHRSLLSFIILQTSWKYSETLSTDSNGFLPTMSTWNLMPLYPSKIDLQTPVPKTPTGPFPQCLVEEVYNVVECVTCALLLLKLYDWIIEKKPLNPDGKTILDKYTELKEASC